MADFNIEVNGLKDELSERFLSGVTRGLSENGVADANISFEITDASVDRHSSNIAYFKVEFKMNDSAIMHRIETILPANARDSELFEAADLLGEMAAQKAIESDVLQTKAQEGKSADGMCFGNLTATDQIALDSIMEKNGFVVQETSGPDSVCYGPGAEKAPRQLGD